MHEISNTAKTEKNKLNTDSLFLICLDITIPDVEEVIHIVNNNENITWNGNEYIAFNFQISDINETTSGEVPEFNVQISNVNNVIGQYVRAYDAYVKTNGFYPIDVTLSVVNTKNLDSPIPEISHTTRLTKPTISNDIVTFTLGTINGYNKIINTRMLRNACRFKFKSTLCGYSGVETSCNKTYLRCKEFSNQTRFGGFPTVGNKGVLL